jgi:two-component system sensor histidine kinase/response regulator
VGCEVDVVGDGGAAITAAATQDYDIILADALMPEIDGLQAIRMIRNLPAPRGSVPIIAMTGRASVEDRTLCLAAGADDFIAKPASPQKLAAAIGTLLAAPQRAARAIEDTIEDTGVPADFGDAAPVLIAIFSAETEARFRRMKSLQGVDDRAALQREAHSLKSAAATFGYRHLAELAGALELGAMQGDLDIAGAIEEMAAAFEYSRKHMVRQIAARREAA